MPGWDNWNVLSKGVYSYYGSTFTNNGRPRLFTQTHVHDAIRDYATRFVRRSAVSDQPFFLWASFVGPHVTLKAGLKPPTPALRHRGMFRDTPLLTAGKPSFNEADMADKPEVFQSRAEQSPRFLTRLFRDRLRTLQSIDEANAAIVRAVARAGELRRTVFLFASDNGYMLGEHRLIEKNYPYAENLRVPLVIRGPGMPVGEVARQTVTMADVAATILHYADALTSARESGRTDGRSILAMLRTEEPRDKTVLIQAGTDNPSALDALGWEFRGVRTSRYTFARWWTGEIELYDRLRDPYELDNLYDNAASALTDDGYVDVLEELERRSASLESCRGPEECEPTSWPPMPTPSGG